MDCFATIPAANRPKIYLVGGAVRDKLRKQVVRECDWVVVHATPQMMLDAGFKQVGKGFPVFLHPRTKEEYALARLERKTGLRHTDFRCDVHATVRLEDDLKRRDLTINAMAESLDGKIIDPYGGRADLKQGVLRHVSPAFSEDPLRVLRVARFATMLPDFRVHADTNALMCQMVQQGALQHLVPERVIKELQKAFAYPQCQRFLAVLHDCGALAVLFPDFPMQATYIALERLAHTFGQMHPQLPPIVQVDLRLALFLFCLPDTKRQMFCVRYVIPQRIKQLAYLLAAHQSTLCHFTTQSAHVQHTVLQKTDALRRPQRFRQIIVLAQSLMSKAASPALISYVDRLIQALSTLDKTSLTEQFNSRQISLHAFKQAFNRMQEQAIQTLLDEMNTS